MQSYDVPRPADSACTPTTKCSCFFICMRCDSQYNKCQCPQGAKSHIYFTCTTFESLQNCRYRRIIFKQVPMLAYWIHKYNLFYENTHCKWKYNIHKHHSVFFLIIGRPFPIVIAIIKFMMRLMDNEDKYRSELFLALLEYLMVYISFLHTHPPFKQTVINKIHKILQSQQEAIKLERLLQTHFHITIHDSLLEWLSYMY